MTEKTEKVTCRTCLSLTDQENTVSIYEFSDMIMLCSSVKISVDDGLPSRMCFECHDKARCAQEFKILCERSDMELRKRLDSLELEQNGNVKDEPLMSPSNSQKGFELNTNVDVKIECDDDTGNVEPEPVNSYLGKSREVCNSLNVDDLKTNNSNCKICDKSFQYKKNLMKHENGHKTNENCCKICGKAFSTRRRFIAHLNLHKRKGSHLCQTCGKQFTMPENLNRHQRIHTGEKRHKCDICNKSFIQSGELKSHMITHTLEKPYLCSFCGNKFARKVSMRVHIRRIHVNSGHAHMCSLCGKKFKDKLDLKQHVLIHSGERKHVCAVCSKAFNRKSNLTVHERIHNGHRPHVCSICHRGFIQKHVLNTHMQKAHSAN